MSSLKMKHKRSSMQQAASLHILSCINGPPMNAEKRLLRRIEDETMSAAVDRASTMTWWPFVLDETPKQDVRWWWWYIPQGAFDANDPDES